MAGITLIIPVDDHLADENTRGFVGDDALGTFRLASHEVDG